MGFRDAVQIRVRAPKGTSCPMIGRPREVITDEPVMVPNTRDYRRLIADGSLELVTVKERKSAIKQRTEEGGK